MSMGNLNAAKEQFITIRDTGATNMLNRTAVQVLAAEYGFDELVVYADEAESYMEIINSF